MGFVCLFFFFFLIFSGVQNNKLRAAGNNGRLGRGSKGGWGVQKRNEERAKTFKLLLSPLRQEGEKGGEEQAATDSVVTCTKLWEVHSRGSTEPINVRNKVQSIKMFHLRLHTGTLCK